MNYSSSQFSVSFYTEFCVFSSSLADYFALYQNDSTENYPSKEPAPAAGKIGSTLGQQTASYFCIRIETDWLFWPSWSLDYTQATFPIAARGLRGKEGGSNDVTNTNRSRKLLQFPPLPIPPTCRRTSSPSSVSSHPPSTSLPENRDECWKKQAGKWRQVTA